VEISEVTERAMESTIAKLSVHIRWMIRRDMPEVLEIENACFDIPWNEENFLTTLRNRNCIGMVAESGEKVIGFYIYELYKTKLRILNFAVLPEYQRCKIGTQLIDKLINKLSAHRRTSITLETRESNLPAQLFFKSSGFKAIKILHNYYDDDETAYRFKYKLKGN
jgi:ribosomal-protein-alanine N-acetyltransferase